MNYTEKEQKGVKKVESMNKFFDKVLLPAIGVLIIFTLISFIVSGLAEKFSGVNSNSDNTASVQNSIEEPKVFELRKAVLEAYDEYSEAFAAYGYEKADGYSQELALCKVVDEELVIFQFKDSTLGDFSILRYTPSESVGSKYSSVSMTVSSSTLINVSVKTENSMYTVAFKSVDFSSYSKNDSVQYNKMMKLISIDELVALYEIFETDINNLAEICDAL